MKNYEEMLAFADQMGRELAHQDFEKNALLAPAMGAVKHFGARALNAIGPALKKGINLAWGASDGQLFAGGGAACGVSGAHAWGYLSGNGLLSAVALGNIAGAQAARQAAIHAHR